MGCGAPTGSPGHVKTQAAYFNLIQIAFFGTQAEMRQEESDGVSCHVQKILAVRQDEKGDLEFQIRWWGFGPEDDTWEPQGNLDRPLTYKWQSKSQKARCKAFMSAA